MDLVFAKDNASLNLDGAQVALRKGTHWPADDPLVQQYPDFFSTDPRWGMFFTRRPDGYDAPIVEQATAAPGEQRAARRRPT